MSLYTEAIQKLYVAYFSRPADPAGLAYWENVVAGANGSTAAVSAAFAGSTEYKAAYAGKSAGVTVDTVYMNLFGRHAEAAGIDYWAPLVSKGTLTIDVVVTAVAQGAQGADLAAYNSKVAAATAFTQALDQPYEQLAYFGSNAILKAIAFLADVTDAATLAGATSAANLAIAVMGLAEPALAGGPAQALTSGADNLSGTGGNDVFTGMYGTFNQGDRITGGSGIDTFMYTDLSVPQDYKMVLPSSPVMLSSVEVVSVQSSFGIEVNATSWTGARLLTLAPGAGGNARALVPGATDVVVGGAGMREVYITGGANISVENSIPGMVAGQGTSLTWVRLDGMTGSATLKGAALDTLQLGSLSHDSTITLVNPTPGHQLRLALAEVGYDPATGKSSDVNVGDAYAANVAIVSTGYYNSLSLSVPNAQWIGLGGSGALALDVNADVNNRLATIYGATATGHINLIGMGQVTREVSTGAGDDVLGLGTATARDNPATAFDESITANVSTGAGQDTVFMRTSGDGRVNVSTGTGDDEVYVDQRSGSETFTIDLGPGLDRFVPRGGVMLPTDRVQGGEGVDVLGLTGISSANAGAFSGFEYVDVTNMNATLDMRVLAPNNPIEAISIWGNVGAAHLTNVPANQEVFLGKDMGNSTLRLSMAASNAVLLRADFDEYGKPDLAPERGAGNFDISNAATVRMVFQSDFLPRIPGESTAGDNLAVLNVSSSGASLATVNSTGLYSENVLNYSDLTSTLGMMNIIGDQRLTLAVISTRLESIVATTQTGGLVVSTASLGNGGTIKLGSGIDTIAIAQTSTPAAFEALTGMEKASAAAISGIPSDALLAIADADTLLLPGGTVASTNTVAGGAVNARGVLTFTGAAPATIDAAFAIASLAAESQGEVLVFSFQNDSFVFMHGAVDTAVKLQGLTGIVGIAETGTDAFYVV